MKITKQFDNLKDAKQFQYEQVKQGKQTNLHGYRVKISYAGKNKTFYDVTSW